MSGGGTRGTAPELIEGDICKPLKPMAGSFQSPRAFRSFRREVLRERRYVWSKAAQEFLQAVAFTCRRRLKVVRAGQRYWRAQLGHQLLFDSDSGERVISPHPEERMRPLSDQAVEGRVNPKGIPCLYFATTPEIAMTEVRPWLGSTISLAAFETTRELKLVDCSNADRGASEPSIEHAVWMDINEAFAEPIVRSDRSGEYAATQILAEVFKQEGADGLTYKSAFSDKGYNLALFDLECARLTESTLFRVESTQFRFAPLSAGAVEAAHK
jgi:RES domain-containing protein